MNAGQNVVMVSMSRYADWMDGIVNRNYFLYRELHASDAVGNIVLVDFLPHTFRRAVKVLVKDILGPAKGTVLYWRPWARIERLDAKTIHVATVLTPWSEKAFCSLLTRFLKDQNIDDAILWSYLATYVAVFSLPWKLTLFDTVDDWTVHPAYRAWRARLVKNYATIGGRADCVVLVTDALRSLFPNRELHTVHNGVDSALFASMRNERAKPPVISYVGTIQERFDVPLMTAIAKARPQYVFEIIGPVWKEVDVAPLAQLPNVRMLGRRSQRDLPALLGRATAGIVPHRMDRLVASMNPMKIFDYLAAGLPVVAIPSKDFSRFGDAMTNATSAQEFCDALDRIVAHPQDPVAIRTLVAHEDWRSRFRTIWSLVTGRLSAS